MRSGKVTFYPSCDYLGEGCFVSRLSGKRYEVRGPTRVVDANYLSPRIPATTPAPFAAADGTRVVPVKGLVDLGGASSEYVIAGAGKTATDACIWLLENGVEPDAICWVRPREPWMLDRAVVQPDPVVFLGTAADITAASNVNVPEVAYNRKNNQFLVSWWQSNNVYYGRLMNPDGTSAGTLRPRSFTR